MHGFDYTLFNKTQDFITESKHMHSITKTNHHFLGPSSKSYEQPVLLAYDDPLKHQVPLTQ
jgi:hypothetical protein